MQGERQNTGENVRRQTENQLQENYSNHTGPQLARKQAQVKQKITESYGNDLHWLGGPVDGARGLLSVLDRYT